MSDPNNDPALIHAHLISAGKPMTPPWLAERLSSFDNSGIRKVFDLAAKLKDPINLSIGQPDFDVPLPVQQACINAIQSGKNSYANSQGVPALREKLQSKIDTELNHDDREVFVCMWN